MTPMAFVENNSSEEDFDVVDDLDLDTCAFDESVFEDAAVESPKCDPGDDAGCHKVLPVPWLSWSDALLAGDVKQTDADGDRILQSFLCDPEQQHLQCDKDVDHSEAAVEIESPCVPPNFPHSQVVTNATPCGGKRATSEPSEEDAETDGESHSAGEESARKRMKRGEHVKGRTEMQETAREGQKHWATKVVELRDQWEKKNVGRLNKQYVWQLRMCERLRVKPQRECLLLALQIATVDGLIMPFPFIDSSTSLGWSGFQVKKDYSTEFRKRIADMFTNDCKSTTINNTFRRAGLVAEGNWERAWRGLSPFVYPHWQTS